MSELIEGQYPGEYIVHEESTDMCRERIVLGSGAGALVDGTVLGQKTADKKYHPLNPGASDGTQVAKGILYRATDATSADADALMTRRLTKVRDENLTWKSGISAGEKTAAIAELEATNIIVQLQY